MSENFKPFFSDESVDSSKLVDCKTVKLTDWIKWASNTSKSDYRVVLPMIQRGAVWAPHKLLDLWDTLLRGMPVGALMASEDVETVGVPIKVLDEKKSQSKKAGDVDLIDGQQRTLAMLAGWPKGLQKNTSRPVAIWVDFLDPPQGEYLFRLWATTKSQPFAYSRASVGGQPLSKLERQKLRLANQAYRPTKEKFSAQELWDEPDFMPWDSKFALPLTKLIENKGKLLEFVKTRLAEHQKALKSKSGTTSTADIDELVAQHFVNKHKAITTTDYDHLTQRIARFEKAIDKLYSYEFPVIHVREENFNDDDQSPDVDADPALAVLFKRVGTGGEPLSNADYVYSVIKHHSNEVHDMVETLLAEDEKICAIYTPTTLVMSAVRLTILSLKSEGSKGQKLTDSAKLDKAAFSRMVRNHPDFIEAFKNYIQPNGKFVTSLKQVLEHISYTNDCKTGLPKHALCLVKIPLLETLLAWHTLRTPSKEALKKSSLAMLRFVLQGNLCILDYAKASEVAIKALKESTIPASETFPDQALLNLLAAVDNPLAYRLPSPGALSTVNGLTISPKETNGLRGWTRFVAKGEHPEFAELYKRWWNRTGRHVHPMLLWLQRDYIFDTFENEAALAGMDEETPFDFDHILPSAQWANWTGSGGENRFIDFPIKDLAGNFLDDSGHWHIGNSIGNIHVLESSENRSWGDASVNEKLDKSSFPMNALIDDQSVWHTASGDKEKGRHWDIERALAFQLAVEQRSFALYQKFYADLQCGS